MLISIGIVSFQACSYLRDCLRSIYREPPGGEFEIIVVDNHSTDGTVDMVKSEFPGVYLIELARNTGFTAPMNQALRQGVGDFLLQLNPDTILLPQAFNQMVAFMKNHPEVGICGPKVLNPDGTLQKPCRRGEPRPFAVFSYFLGLSKLFPKSELFGGYLLNHLDEDETHEVAGVSGSCMLIRREVVDRIGFLDERYFAYQEDADYCYQARNAGWQVYYVPAARIMHYGGQGGSRVKPYRSILEWHRSYYLYYRKNLAADYFILFNWFYYLAMFFKLVLALLQNALRQGKFSKRR